MRPVTPTPLSLFSVTSTSSHTRGTAKGVTGFAVAKTPSSRASPCLTLPQASSPSSPSKAFLRNSAGHVGVFFVCDAVGVDDDVVLVGDRFPVILPADVVAVVAVDDTVALEESVPAPVSLLVAAAAVDDDNTIFPHALPSSALIEGIISGKGWAAPAPDGGGHALELARTPPPLSRATNNGDGLGGKTRGRALMSLQKATIHVTRMHALSALGAFFAASLV